MRTAFFPLALIRTQLSPADTRVLNCLCLTSPGLRDGPSSPLISALSRGITYLLGVGDDSSKCLP